MNGRLLFVCVLAALMAVAFATCPTTHDCDTCFKSTDCKLVWKPKSGAECKPTAQVASLQGYTVPTDLADCKTKRAETSNWKAIRRLAERLVELGKSCGSALATLLYTMSGGKATDPMAAVPGIASGSTTPPVTPPTNSGNNPPVSPPNTVSGSNAPVSGNNSPSGDHPSPQPTTSTPSTPNQACVDYFKAEKDEVFEVKFGNFAIVIMKEKFNEKHVYHVYFDAPNHHETLLQWMTKTHSHNNHVLFGVPDSGDHHAPKTDPTKICGFLSTVATSTKVRDDLAAAFGIKVENIPEDATNVITARKHEAFKPADLLTLVNNPVKLTPLLTVCSGMSAQGLEEDDEAVEENEDNDVSADTTEQTAAQNMDAEEDEEEPAVLIHLKSLIRHRNRGN